MADNFTDAVNWLSSRLDASRRYSLSAKTGDHDTATIPDKLRPLLLLLPEQTLTLTDAGDELKKGPPQTWILKGKPTRPIPIPMLPGVSVVVTKDAVVTLTVGEKPAQLFDEETDFPPPSFRFEVEGVMEIGTQIPIKLVWVDKDLYKQENIWELTIGPGADSTARGVPLPLGILVEKLTPLDISDTDLKNEVMGVSIRAKGDDKGGRAEVTALKGDGLVTFLGVRCKVKLGLSRGDGNRLQTSLQLIWEQKQGGPELSLNRLLRSEHASSTLPDGIDIGLKKFEANYDGESRRLTVAADATRGGVTMRIVRGRDKAKKVKHTIFRLFFPRGVLLGDIPALHDSHVKDTGLTNISVLICSKEIAVADVCLLAGITTPPELVNLGLKTKEAEEKKLAAGIYAVGLFQVMPDYAKLAFRVPIKSWKPKKEDKPDEQKDDSKKKEEEQKAEEDEKKEPEEHKESEPPGHKPDDEEHKQSEPPRHTADDGEHKASEPPGHTADDGEHKASEPPRHTADDGEHKQSEPPGHKPDDEEHKQSEPPGHKPDEPPEHKLDDGEHKQSEPPRHTADDGEHKASEPPGHTADDGEHKESEPPRHTADDGEHKASEPPGHTADDGEHKQSEPPGHKPDDEEDWEVVDESEDDEADPPPATALPLLGKLGPLSLIKVTFKFEDGKVWLLFDLAVGAGKENSFVIQPLNPRIGFSFSALQKPDFAIDGVMIGLKTGAFELTGAGVHDSETGDYAGLMAIKVGEAFTMQAVGAYRPAESPEFFVTGYFSRGKTPLLKTPWIDITGIILGGGMNRAFKLPRVDEIDKVPFVQIAQGTSDRKVPQVADSRKQIDTKGLWEFQSGIREFVPSCPGQNFVTAGFTGTSFGIFESVLLLNVAWGHSVEVIALGRSVCDFPKEKPIGRMEFNIEVAVLPEKGFIGIAGAIGSGSYLFSKDCVPTGEFACNFWFDGPHKNDFVITFGGYHPYYTPPAHYPQVPRIGLVWKLNSSTTLMGSVYFAVTPREIMAGVSYDLVYQQGPIRAWGHFELHALIAWAPFHYDIDIYVDLGLSLRFDLGFCTFTISLDVSIKVGLWGPPFSGRADVHVVISFSFPIGDDTSRELRPPRQSWGEFTKTFLPAADTTKRNADTTKHNKVAHTGAAMAMGAMPETTGAPSASGAFDIVASNGITIGPSGGPDWLIDPHHVVINVVTTVAGRHGEHNGVRLACEEDIKLAVLPCEFPSVAPVLSVDIKRGDDVVHDLKAELVIGKVPTALWGEKGEKRETIPAIVAIRLYSEPPPPDQTAPMSFEVVGYETRLRSYAWEKPAPVPNGSFVYETSEPAITIGSEAVVARRNALVQEILARGLLALAPSESPLSVDVSSIQHDEFCFMAPLPLCRLGAEEFAA